MSYKLSCFVQFCYTTYSKVYIIVSSLIKKLIVDASGIYPSPQNPKSMSALHLILGLGLIDWQWHTHSHMHTHTHTHKHSFNSWFLSNVPTAQPCQTSASLTNVKGTRHWSHNWMIMQLMHLGEHEGDSGWTWLWAKFWGFSRVYNYNCTCKSAECAQGFSMCLHWY